MANNTDEYQPKRPKHKWHSVKRVYLTEEQAELFAANLDLIADAAEKGEALRFPMGQNAKPVKMSVVVALRNQAAWLRRTFAEQNGGRRLVGAWDYPEIR